MWYTETKTEPGWLRIGDSCINLRKANYIQPVGEDACEVQFENGDKLTLNVTAQEVADVLFPKKDDDPATPSRGKQGFHQPPRR